MMYYDFEVGNKAYKLRLNTRDIITLEKALGCNPLSIFTKNGAVGIPTVTDMVAVLHASLQQYHHGISMSDAYDIFDTYVAEGNMSYDFANVIVEIYQVSGIMPKNAVNEKN